MPDLTNVYSLTTGRRIGAADVNRNEQVHCLNCDSWHQTPEAFVAHNCAANRARRSGHPSTFGRGA